MKKFLLFFALILMGAMWSSVDARWIIGDRKNAAGIKAGDTIVIEQSSIEAYKGYYIQTVSNEKGVAVLQGVGADNASIIAVEEGPTDALTGSPTVILRMLSTDMYIAKGVNWDAGCGVTKDPANAANFIILDCSTDIPWTNTVAWDNSGAMRPGHEGEDQLFNWRTNASGRGSDDNSVGFAFFPDDKTKNVKYLAFWKTKEPNVLNWQYTDTNQWDVYSASYEKSLQDDLANLIDSYTSDNSEELIGGTDPGYYDSEKVEAYNTALESALIASVTPNLSDEEYQTAIDNLKSAREEALKSLVKITEGYYFFVNAFSDFLDNFGVEKAAYIDGNVPNLKYKTFDDTNIDFVFKVAPGANADEYYVQSLANEYYVAKGTQWYNSNPAATIDPEEAQNIRLRYTGMWYWGSATYHNTSYTPYASNAPTATDSQGNLTSWGVWNDEASTRYHSNLWYLRKLTDAQMEMFAEKKIQSDRNASLRQAVNAGNDLYNKLFTVTTDFDKPLITRASGGYGEDPAADAQITFSTIRRQGISTADQYKFLIDGDTLTYMQGSGYITLKLDEPKQFVTFVYGTRGGNEKQHLWGLQERPKMVNIYGANTLAGDTAFGSAILQNVDMSEIAPHTVNLSRPVNRIAYQVTLNNNNGAYFTLSEFQVYEAKIDQEKSQYYTVEGLKDAADALSGVIDSKRSVLDAGNATEDDIADVQKAIEAVKALYADTSELRGLIDKAENYIANLPVGDAVGQLSNEEAKQTLAEAVTAARELGLKEDVSKEDLTLAINNLTAALNGFLAQVKGIEQGKWYYILSADQSENSTLTGKALYRSGADEKNTLKTGKLTEGSPSYTYDPYSMWRFVTAEDGGYYVQNMGSGFYMPACSGNGSTVSQVYKKDATYDVTLEANGTYTLKANKNNNRRLVITAVGAEEGDGEAKFQETGAASAWKLIEINPEQVEYITVTDFKLNAMDVMALPYNYGSVSDLNDGCAVYGIKKMTYNKETDETTVDFYEKDEVAANEPAFFKFGNIENEYEEFELLLPFPTEFADELVPSNGIYGMLHSEKIEEGVGYASGKGLVVAGAGGTTVSAHTGAINPAYYTGEVEGVETAFSLSVKGMVWPTTVAGDVNGDGRIDATDVVTLYNYIASGTESGVSLEAADVNGDGKVDGADVVEVYNIASGSSAQSGAFGKEIVGASEIIPADQNDKALLTISVGSTTDLAKIPVSVILTNPEVEITAVEGCMFSPAGVSSFLYDEVNEDFVYDTTDRWTRSHGNTSFAGTKLHGFDWFFFSIVSSKSSNFKGNDGVIATFYFDGSKLADGNYEIKLKDAISVWTDKRNTKTYDAKPMSSTFTISGGKATGVEGVEAESGAKAGSAITVDGKAASSLQKGQIYIIDGKKTKF